MSKTLVYKDTIQRIGHTIIDDVKVVQYTCTIPLDKPEDMRVIASRLQPELYKENRDICRADLAAFEDAAYELQEQCLQKAE